MPDRTLSQSRATEKFDRRRRRILLLAEVTLVLTVLWLIGPRIAAVRIAGPYAPALALVLVSWICAFSLRLSIWFAVSWDDFSDVVVASLRASAPAMWFGPAVLLITTPSRYAMAAGLLLVANTTRLVVAQAAPRKLAPPPAPDWTKRYRIFRQSMVPEVSFTREILPAVLGALALQSGLCGVWLGQPLYAAVLMGCGAAIWTYFSLAKGAMERRDETKPSHWLVSIVVTLLLTTILSVAQIRIQASMNGLDVEEATLLDSAQVLWDELHREGMPVTLPPLPDGVPLAKGAKGNKNKGTQRMSLVPTGHYLVPGVIVRPEVQSKRPLLVVPSSLRGGTKVGQVEQTMKFPFSGEYRLYPGLSSTLEHDWAIETGTLLEHSYATAGGTAMQTEAYQKLVPPLDLANCGQVRVVLVSSEEYPFSASMVLETAEGPMPIGTQLCLLKQQEAETLEFSVPAGAKHLPVQAIRIAFRRIPKQGSESMKVAVKEFTLVPR